MRPLAVEALEEAVELGLLLQEVFSGGERVASFLRVRCMRSRRPFCCVGTKKPGTLRSKQEPYCSQIGIPDFRWTQILVSDWLKGDS